MAQFSRTSIGLVLAVLALGCGGGGESGCAPADPVCAPKAAVFEVVLDDAPPDVGALLIAVSATASKTVSPAGGGRIMPSSPLPTGPGSLSAIVLNPSPGQVFARITFVAPQAADPAVIVTSAARNAAGGYQVIPLPEIRVRVRRVQ